jgi:HEAT repeat protein
MSRGLIIAIVLLSVALAGLLFISQRKSSVPLPATNGVAVTPATSTPPPSRNTSVPPVRPAATSTHPGYVSPAVRSNIAHRVLTMVTNDASVTNLLHDPPAKTLPELERDYATTTNSETRLDAMMDIAEAGNAEAVKALTRLFEVETNADLKVDLLDSLLGIDGFKEEKLIMLTLGVRQGLPAEVRQSAIDGLIDLEDTRSMALLNGLLNDPDPEIRQSAQDAIEILQAPPTQIPRLKP